jgi:uncharacterized protein with FMN-binding domain
MKRAALAVVSTVAALVMLLSFKTHSPSSTATPPAAVSTNTGSSNGNGNGNANGSSGSSSSANSTGSAAKTYTGDAADTRYGPVQVQITVRQGNVVSATAVDYPMSDPRDAQINSSAIPALNSEAASAGSSSIQMISGATYTSEGYIASLQSALDKAGL